MDGLIGLNDIEATNDLVISCGHCSNELTVPNPHHNFLVQKKKRLQPICERDCGSLTITNNIGQDL